MNRRIFIIAAVLSIFFSSAAYCIDESESKKNKGDDYSTSVYIRYNLLKPEYAETPYFFGADGGIDIDLGGTVPVINLSGVGISSRYTLFNSENKDSGDISYSHYFSAGISYYIKTRFRSIMNFGLRAGTGSGWLINNEIDPETENNKRLSGLYFDTGIFTELTQPGKVFFESGFESRRQHYYKKDTDIDPVDMAVLYIKAGLKL